MTVDRIGQYRIVRTLGAGGYATVYLAHDEDLDGLVAIKVLAENWSADADARARFMEEARILRRLDNERIVGVHAIGRLDSGQPYFVMEYADRGSLDQRIAAHRDAGAPYSIAEALGISAELAESLRIVHGLGVVHRDLKPSNILFRASAPSSTPATWRLGVDPGERMLLADFGIARRLGAASGRTITAGTPFYMAPEQARPETTGQADPRSDIYSAAVILFELLTGRLPDSPADVASGTLVSDVGSQLLALRADVTGGLAELVRRGTRPDPADRWPSADAWADAIAAVSGSAALAGQGLRGDGGRPTIEPQRTPVLPGAGVRDITQGDRGNGLQDPRRGSMTLDDPLRRTPSPLPPKAPNRRRLVFGVAAALVFVVLALGAGFGFGRLGPGAGSLQSASATAFAAIATGTAAASPSDLGPSPSPTIAASAAPSSGPSSAATTPRPTPTPTPKPKPSPPTPAPPTPTLKPTPTPIPSLTSPANGATIGQTVAFKWSMSNYYISSSLFISAFPPPNLCTKTSGCSGTNSVADAAGYEISIVPSNCDAGEGCHGMAPGVRSRSVTGWANGSTVYVRLIAWHNPSNNPEYYRDYVFHASW